MRIQLAKPCTHQACSDASQGLRDDTPVQCSSKEWHFDDSFHLNLVKFMNLVVSFHTFPSLKLPGFAALEDLELLAGY